METPDFPIIIDELLQRPLLSLHIHQLNELKQKSFHDGLGEVDRIYLTDLWEKFRFLPAARRDALPKDKDADAANSGALVQEMKRLNVTIEKLRAALKQVVNHRDDLKKQVEELSKPAALASTARVDHRFEKTKVIFAKFYHPNTFSGYSNLETSVRIDMFKEFWPELERIEAEG